MDVTRVTAIFHVVRAVIISHTYANPAARGKLHALAGQGVALAAAVPEEWRAPGATEPFRTRFSEENGVRIVPVVTRGIDAGGIPSSWRVSALRQLLTDFRPDIVQVEEEPFTRAAAATARLARALGIPAIAFTAESVPRPLPLLARRRRRRTLHQVRGLLGVNQLASSLARVQVPELTTAALPQLGLPVPRAPAPERHAPLAIGFVGRLVPEKGCDVLLRACARLYGAWNLSVAGTGPEQEALERLAERLGVASRVTWMGGVTQQDLAALWPRLDCLVAPSRGTAAWVESYPLQVLEAMSHGVAVVVSDSGALPETVGRAGLTFGDGHPEGLTDALTRLLEDAALRERLAAEGRRRVIGEYVDDAIARKTLAFWRDVLNGRAA